MIIETCINQTRARIYEVSINMTIHSVLPTIDNPLSRLKLTYIPATLTHWIPLHSINCAQLGIGPLFKFNDIVYYW